MKKSILFKSVILGLLLVFSMSMNGNAIDLSVGVPPGNNTEVPFNDGGEWGTDSEFTYDKATDKISTAMIDLTGVTDGNFPYMQAAGAGFGDSPLWRTDANTITLQATTGNAATLVLSADAGEDNADDYRIQVADNGDVTLQTYTSGSWVTISTWTSAGAYTVTGALAGTTLNTGQGANELYAMNQDVETTDAVTFATVDTGQGANELYDMDQNVLITSAVTFATVDTGQGANELYAMNQDVETTDSPTFVTAKLSGLTDNYLPKHTNDSTGLENSAVSDSGTAVEINQNSVQPFTSVASGAVDNTLYLKEGKVGIGTASPGKILEVYKNGSMAYDGPAICLARDSGGRGAAIFSGWSGTENFFGIGVSSSTSYAVHGSGGEKVRVLNSGNVGIMTTAPDKALEVNSATGANLRLTFNDGDGSAANYADFATTTNGSLTITTGANASHVGIVSGQTVKKTNVSDTAYNPSALTSDYIIAFTSLTAARACTISTEDEDSGTATQPRVMIIKDQSGSAETYNITITLESGGTIDGAASYVMDTNYESVTLYIDGTSAYIY